MQVADVFGDFKRDAGNVSKGPTFNFKKLITVCVSRNKADPAHNEIVAGENLEDTLFKTLVARNGGLGGGSSINIIRGLPWPSAASEHLD